MAETHMKRRLAARIIAWSLVPTVIILSAVAWFTFYSYQNVLVDLAVRQYPEIVPQKAKTFVDAFGGMIVPYTVPIFLEISSNHELPLEVRAEHILDKIQGLDIFDGGIYFLDKQGKVFKTQPDQPELIGQDWSDTPHFRSISATPNMSAFTDLIPIGTSGRKVICAATAMTGQTWTDVEGAFYLCVTVFPAAQNHYYQTMSSLDLGVDLYVLDRNNQVIYSPDLPEMGRDLSGEDYIQQLSQGKGRSGLFRIGGQDTVVSYVPVGGTLTDRVGWYAMTRASRAEIMQPSLSYRRLLFVLLALGVLMPVLVTAYGVRHITNPLQKLVRASEQVTAGKFKQKIDVKTGDEIETLADQFNQMSARLDDSYSSLEKKVADRTRELAIMNSIISVASHSLEIREILENVLDHTAKQMGFDAGVAFKLEPYPALPLLMAQRDFEPSAAVDLISSYATAGRGEAQAYPKEVVTFRAEDLRGETLKDCLSRFDFKLLVYIPLTTKGRELGFFVLGRREAGPLAPEELSLLDSIGKQVGVALENARLYEQAEQAAIDAERHRLARELHDAVTQTLFSASLIADVLPRIWERDPEEGLRNLEELRQLTRGALAEMRTMLLEMRPESLERADIKSLLTQLSDAFIGRVRIPLDLQIHGQCVPAREVKIVFYRVAQEALNNIAKHSGARQVDMDLDCQPGGMNLCIQDDGLGFEPGSIPPDHMGIAIMRERAGSIGARLQIESRPGQGTTVTLAWQPA